MWRQARGRSPTLVERQANGTPPKANATIEESFKRLGDVYDRKPETCE
jgi:hypothetical protein